MSSSRTQAIIQAAEKAINEQVFPGCVVGVVGADGESEVYAFGHHTYESGAPLVREDTLYDTASLTKSIPTGSLALQLIEESKIALSDKLIEYVPEFNNSDREEVLLQHLLTYTLDGYGLASAVDNGDGRSLNERTAEDMFAVLFTKDFERRPGMVFKYSNIPAALMGIVVERVFGKPIDVLAEERFFGPLGMTRSTFAPERFPLEEIAPTEENDWRGLAHGVVHDESAYICKRDGVVVGHAGLFSTAPDILRFLHMLLNQGSLDGTRYFSPETVRSMGTNQIAHLNDFTGLGWELNQPRYMGEHCSEHTFGKTGFTGTLAACDVARGVGWVVLSNRTYPHRPSDSVAINAFRKKIGEIVLGQ